MNHPGESKGLEAQDVIEKESPRPSISFPTQLLDIDQNKFGGSNESNSLTPSPIVRNGKAKNEDWSDLDNSRLFLWQKELGNSWSVIAKRLGRSDNSVKNHFYSTFRRAVRHINKFIKKFCRKSPVKQVGNRALLSILAGAEEGRAGERTLTFQLCSRCQAIKEKLIRYKFSNEIHEQDSLLDLSREMLEVNRLIKLQKQQLKVATDHKSKKRLKCTEKIPQMELQQNILNGQVLPSAQDEQKIPERIQQRPEQAPSAFQPYFSMPPPWMFQMPPTSSSIYQQLFFYHQLQGWQ